MVRLRSLALAASSALILSVAVLCPLRANAVGFQPVSPDELKMTSEPKAPGASAIVLYRQVDRDDNGVTSHEDNYFRIKILREEGRSHADIEIPFSKEGGENIVNIRARTIRPDGSIANFEGKVFEKTIVKAKGVKYLAKTFTLPDVQPGSILEYFYTVDLRENFIYNSRWIISSELFTKNAKFSLKSYSGFNLRWSWQGISTTPNEGPDKIVRIEVRDIPAFETEDFMPPANELKARVDFIYSSDSFENDPVKFWKKAGKKMNDVAESFIKKHKVTDEAVSHIVSPTDSPEDKAKKLYMRVQQLRNTSYEVSKTEQEKKRDKEKELTNVDEVLQRGYGDSVQLTRLYLAMVRTAGINAYEAMVSDRRDYLFNPKQLDSSRLNSNVVLIRFKDQDVYCDPGSAFTPFGLLPWSETGVKGLRLDKDGGSWIETPLPDSSVSQVARKANLKLIAETGSLEGKLTVTYTGLEAAYRRVDQRNQDETARKKFIEDEVRESIPAAIEVELINSPEWKNSSLPLVAEFNLQVPGWASAAGRRAMLTVGLFSATEKRVFDHAGRAHPIYYAYPNSKLDDVTIDLPDGWRVSSLPQATNDVQPIIGYTSKVTSENGTLHLFRKFSTDILMIESKYYSALQNFYRMVRTSDEQQIVLLPGSTAASK
jgi:Domain of Unknown Function with PDB structure (DUF3857)/Transglutaminase-like superfamily